MMAKTRVSHMEGDSPRVFPHHAGWIGVDCCGFVVLVERELDLPLAPVINEGWGRDVIEKPLVIGLELKRAQCEGIAWHEFAGRI